MNAIEANGTCILVDTSAGKRSIGCKWVFIVEVNLNGSTQLKARLVT